MTNDEKMKLAADARNTEVTARWTMFMLFFAIHSGALSLVLVQLRDVQPNTDVRLYVYFCVVGLMLANLWRQATYRSQKLIDFWHRKMADIEEEQEERKERESRIIKVERKEMIYLERERRIDVFFDPRQPSKVPSPEGVPLYKTLSSLVWIFIFVWFAAFLNFFLLWKFPAVLSNLLGGQT